MTEFEKEPTAVTPVEESGAVVGDGSGEWLEELTPREIVRELDKYIVGQDDAKKSVAIALRNRWRRQKVEEELPRGDSPEQPHPHRSHGRGKNGDLPAPGPVLRQGRGLQVHGGGLRGPGRGVHDPGPRGHFGEHGPGRTGSRGGGGGGDPGGGADPRPSPSHDRQTGIEAPGGRTGIDALTCLRGWPVWGEAGDR